MNESNARGSSPMDTKVRELVITRILDAPVEKVWEAWTDQEMMKKWWGPKDFTAPVCQIDLRVGGKYLNCMRSPEGKDYWSTGKYLEIIPMKKLALSDSFADEKGNVVPATYYGMDEAWPLEMKIEVAFEEQDGKTNLTLKHSSTEGISETELRNMQQGWNESFDKLNESLK